MSRLGSAQIGMLEAMALYPERGVCKGDTLAKDWRVIDRLERLGLCRAGFVLMQGTTYFITDAGHAALTANNQSSEG